MPPTTNSSFHHVTWIELTEAEVIDNCRVKGHPWTYRNLILHGEDGSRITIGIHSDNATLSASCGPDAGALPGYPSPYPPSDTITVGEGNSSVSVNLAPGAVALSLISGGDREP
jgi:hypothetical protein